MLQSLQKCLELRDKYMKKSKQRLGDNPKDYDGTFPGVDEERAGVCGVKPDSNFAANQPPPQPSDKWTVYPPPPPPHWHWTDQQQTMSAGGPRSPIDEFNFEQCHIPTSDSKEYSIDDTGVFQIYENAQKSCTSFFSV